MGAGFRVTDGSLPSACQFVTANRAGVAAMLEGIHLGEPQ